MNLQSIHEEISTLLTNSEILIGNLENIGEQLDPSPMSDSRTDNDDEPSNVSVVDKFNNDRLRLTSIYHRLETIVTKFGDIILDRPSEAIASSPKTAMNGSRR